MQYDRIQVQKTQLSGMKSADYVINANLRSYLSGKLVGILHNNI